MVLCSWDCAAQEGNHIWCSFLQFLCGIGGNVRWVSSRSDMCYARYTYRSHIKAAYSLLDWYWCCLFWNLSPMIHNPNCSYHQKTSLVLPSHIQRGPVSVPGISSGSGFSFQMLLGIASITMTVFCFLSVVSGSVYVCLVCHCLFIFCCFPLLSVIPRVCPIHVHHSCICIWSLLLDCPGLLSHPASLGAMLSSSLFFGFWLI